jgi:hypothetical protein
MYLQIESLNSQAYFNALFKLNTSSIKNASWCQCYKLLNYHFDHKESQSDSENDDENKAFETVQSDKNIHSLMCNHVDISKKWLVELKLLKWFSITSWADLISDQSWSWLRTRNLLFQRCKFISNIQIQSYYYSELFLWNINSSACWQFKNFIH